MIFAALVFTQCLPNIEAGIIDAAGEILETTEYEVLKKALVAEGYSEDKANCIIEVWKFQGVTADVTDLSNYMDPDKMGQKLENKAKFADYICKKKPLIIVFFIIMVVMILYCCCFYIRRSCKKQPSITPATIHSNIPLSSNGCNIPYEEVDNVRN